MRKYYRLDVTFPLSCFFLPCSTIPTSFPCVITLSDSFFSISCLSFSSAVIQTKTKADEQFCPLAWLYIFYLRSMLSASSPSSSSAACSTSNPSSTASPLSASPSSTSSASISSSSSAACSASNPSSTSSPLSASPSSISSTSISSASSETKRSRGKDRRENKSL